MHCTVYLCFLNATHAGAPNPSIHSPLQAYNITQGPLPFWSFIGKVLQAVDLPPPRIKLPYLLIYYLSVLLQFVCFLLSPLVTIRPTFTPMRVALAGTHHYYSSSRAIREFGYRPVVGMEEGLSRAMQHFKQGEEEEEAARNG